MVNGMSVQIAVRLADDELARLDDAVARGLFPSRAAAVRAGLAAVLRAAREAQIADAYRRGYGADPQDAAIGRMGLQLGAATVALEIESASPAHER
jgi:Arc/MetJ-type ribon-helix-helix transcriptional regulator